jgi:cytochrome c553
MKSWLVLGAALGAAAALGAFLAFLVAASGIIPIKASSGHFAITEWFLQFGKQRSVAMHTLGTELSGLDDAALVIKGAGSYESNCRPCHGSPGLPRPRIARAMLPPPPRLADRVGDWEPEELFYIVKHGIKFTGMPAWPSQQRDDEVRAVVAFLLKYPDLDAAGYRRLVYGETPQRASNAVLAEPAGERPLRTGTATCARCHGEDGQGRGEGAFPRLAGQHADYLFNALVAYANDHRQSGIMQPIAAGLSEHEMRELASHYAGLTPSSPVVANGPSDSIERGRKIASEGVESVPSCTECHGPAAHERNTAYPVLAGQHPDYLVLQLELLQERRRGGSAYVHIMHKVVARLDSQQMRDTAAYYASRPHE